MKALRNPLMILGMIVSWSVFYAISKVLVDATGSAVAAGAALRLFALVFLTAQLVFDKEVRLLFHQGRTAWVLLLIGVFGFLLDLFANLGYAGGSLSTGTALLKTDVLMVDLVTVALYHKRLYATDWLGTGVMLLGVLFVLGVDFRGMEIHLTDLFFLLSAACVTANAFLIKSAQTHPQTDSDMISYYNNFVVLLLFSVSCGVTGALTPERLAVLGRLWPLAVLLWFGYGWTLKRGKFFKTLVCGMFWLVIQSYALAGMAWTVMQEPGFRWRSPILIVLGLLSMFGVGFREEAIFRGIIANAIGCRLGKDRRGVWKSVLLSGLIFGLVHLFNLFHGVNPIAALVQCATASALGMVFTAVYYRGGSLWGLVFLHSLTDIAGMFRSNFTELATDLDDLNQLNPLSLILIPIFLLVLAFLLRKKKMPEIMANLQEP